MIGPVPPDRRSCRRAIGIIAPIGNEPLQASWSGGEHLGRGPDVAGIAGRQVDHRRATKDIGDDVNLRGLPAA